MFLFFQKTKFQSSRLKGYPAEQFSYISAKIYIVSAL